MDVTARWAEVVARPEAEVHLDEAALLISAAGNPGLDVAGQLARLDGLAAQVARPDCAAVCDLLFADLGLCGDRGSYDDPRNSYIDQVLDRALGIPISLSVLPCEIGRRRGLALEPVGMPGHFLVRDPSSPDELIDAFAGGRRLDPAGCQAVLSSLSGGAARLTPEMLAPLGAHAVLARMLANLDGSFDRRRDTTGLAWVSDLRLHLREAPLGDRTQLAGRLAAQGRFDVAATVLEAVAAGATGDEIPGRMLAQARELRARLN